jgi:hypothetical protein
MYIGNVNAPSISIGKTDTIFVNNATSPPVVAINGQQAATVAYVDSHGTELFGQGTDGPASLTGNNVLTRDIYYSDLTLASGAVLTTAGFRLLVNGTLNLQGTARINCDGNVGANGISGAAGAGGLSLPVGSLGGGSGGGAGGAPTGIGSSGGSGSTSVGSAGGTGGIGRNSALDTTTASGLAGTVTAPTAVNGGSAALSDVILATRGRDLAGNKFTGGSGGGGGGGSVTTSGGGGGGGGGGVLMVAANTITGAGFITARGGNGGGGNSDSTAGSGGGGGGGGGCAIVVYRTLIGWSTANVLVNGGNGGASSNFGAQGAAGTAGRAILFGV